MKHGALMDAADLVSSGNKEDIQRGLSIAASVEKESIEFYSKQAEKSKNAELKKFWEWLVKEEKGHLKAIENVKKSVQESNDWMLMAMPNEEFKAFAEKDWDREEQDSFTAVLFALWKEEEAKKFYLKAAAQTKDENAKKFFEKLADFEHSHARLLGEFVEESYYSHELIMG